MKKIIMIVVILCFASEVLAKNEKKIYIPLDHIQVPHLGSDWTYQLGEDADRIKFKQIQNKNEKGIFPKQIKLTRRSLKNHEKYSQNTWKNTEVSSFPKKYKITQKTSVDAQNYFINFEHTVNLITIEGTQISYLDKDYVYRWQCERENTANNKNWCLDLFHKIVWSKNVKIENEKAQVTINDYVRSLSFDKTGMDEEYKRIINQLSLKRVSYNDLKTYGFYLIVKSLLNLPENETEKTVLFQNIKKLSETLAVQKKPVEPLAEWLLVNLDVLNKTFSLNKAKILVDSKTPPPFWLLSLWVESYSLDTAISLALRDTNDLPLSHYLLARYSLKNNNPEKAIGYLNNLADKNSLSLYLLAESFYKTGKINEAESYAQKAVARDGTFIQAKLLLAKILNEKEGGKTQAVKIFDELAHQENLKPADKAIILIERAKQSEHPDEQIMRYQDALRQDPESLDSLYALGRLYLLEKNDKDKSLFYFQEFIKKAPKTDSKIDQLSAMIEKIKLEEKIENENNGDEADNENPENNSDEDN